MLSKKKKKTTPKLKKMVSHHIANKGLVSRLYEQNQIKKKDKDLIVKNMQRYFFKEVMQMANKPMKRR